MDVVIVIFGRFFDLCKRGFISFDKVLYLVMDEVDKMFGMGLEE